MKLYFIRNCHTLKSRCENVRSQIQWIVRKTWSLLLFDARVTFFSKTIADFNFLLIVYGLSTWNSPFAYVRETLWKTRHRFVSTFRCSLCIHFVQFANIFGRSFWSTVPIFIKTCVIFSFFLLCIAWNPEMYLDGKIDTLTSVETCLTAFLTETIILYNL